MTFNILHDAVRNLTPLWAVRRPAVVRTIRDADPDIACLQEVSLRQLDHLKEDLPEYDFIPGIPTGVTRAPRLVTGLLGPILGDFLDRGEVCPVLVRRDRVTVAQHGCARLCFSEAGLGPAWADSPTPHVVTWVRLEGFSPSVTIYNTHLGILPWNWARTARELLLLLGRDWNGETQILVGDFNALPGGPLLRLLRNGGDDPAKAFRDAWHDAKVREGRGRTFHWGFGWPGPRLDYVMVRPTANVLKAMVIEERKDGVFPSDHFPLVADLHQGGAG
jgi:endonuclease/exonuclease/phosphatase family metal-dependent hydrolase